MMSNPSISNRLTPVLLAVVLLLIAAAALYHQPDSVTPDEARLMWVVRDEVKLQPAAPREFARTALNNVTTSLNRARTEGIFPLYPLILKGWTWLAGDDVRATRLLTLMWLLVGLVLLASFLHPYLQDHFTLLTWLLLIGWFPPLVVIGRQVNALPFWFALVLLILLIGRRIWYGKSIAQPGDISVSRGRLIFITALLALELIAYRVLIPSPPDWNGTIARYLVARDTLHPALTAFSPDSVAGYYAAHEPLRAGIALDLGWREFTLDEIDTIIGKLDAAAPVWVVMPIDAPITQQVMSKLSQNRSVDYSGAVVDMV
ncbi:MAG TPA: hypothetical protein VHL11_16755, partial [Phototrophicaceae bacterium]|nr:hypothetical protein [Phototrophicaceae bacterium]